MSPYIPVDAAQGKWDLLHFNIGISAMHMQLLNNDKVVILDRTDFGPSNNISLPNERCRNYRNGLMLWIDCTTHSVEYDVVANSVRPLMVLTNTWCSSGAVTPDGSLIKTDGFIDGSHNVRTLKMLAPPYTTHSFSMNQRLLVLDGRNITPIALSKCQILVMTPNSRNLAPPGYYLLFGLHQDTPSEGIWIQI